MARRRGFVDVRFGLRVVRIDAEILEKARQKEKTAIGW